MEEKLKKSPKARLALAAIWIIGSLGFVGWKNYALAYNVAAIACGYPDTGAKTYPACFASYFHKAGAAIWPQFIYQGFLWAILPLLVLYACGLVFAKITRQEGIGTKSIVVGTGIAIAVMAVVYWALAARSTHCDSRDDQVGGKNIRACTAALQSTSLSNYDRAMTLNIRGNNYDGMKEYDLAISDYTEVIRLKPDFEYAYANRGLEK